MNTSLLRYCLLSAITLFGCTLVSAQPPEPTEKPLFTSVDLNVGEEVDVLVRFPGIEPGDKVHVKLLDLKETRDPLRNAVREARVKLNVNDETITLTSANYNLPVMVGRVQVDCPITRGCYSNSGEDSWGLKKDARLRIWLSSVAWMKTGTFGYPVKQRWFASGTQMANEPCFVDGGDLPTNKKIYYHDALDFGGCEGMVDVVAATDGLVVSAAKETLPGYEGTPVKPRGDVVYVLDARGWYYRYSHLCEIDPAMKPGAKVKLGQRIGVLGKEGASGGWAHLHFGIKARQPSGAWGTEEAYAFIWEASARAQTAHDGYRPAASTGLCRREGDAGRQQIALRQRLLRNGCITSGCFISTHSRTDVCSTPRSGRCYRAASSGATRPSAL